MLCKEGGFVTLPEEFCNDVDIKPALQPFTVNDLVTTTANTNNNARSDVNTRSFWITGLSDLYNFLEKLQKHCRKWGLTVNIIKKQKLWWSKKDNPH